MNRTAINAVKRATNSALMIKELLPSTAVIRFYPQTAQVYPGLYISHSYSSDGCLSERNSSERVSEPSIPSVRGAPALG